MNLRFTAQRKGWAGEGITFILSPGRDLLKLFDFAVSRPEWNGTSLGDYVTSGTSVELTMSQGLVSVPTLTSNVVRKLALLSYLILSVWYGEILPSSVGKSTQSVKGKAQGT
ncbi:hypothetical protein AVEN_82945-1 [Araneus ventricosus]|uniref:Uncharacterized protein n=1 Tax=Araneus ventricosus TaxID=182803 RepID=A0A4Y2CYA0_ARAVE|nr:hypothetical protein AVEN_82945-1 [Araneus ventricosus]